MIIKLRLSPFAFFIDKFDHEKSDHFTCFISDVFLKLNAQDCVGTNKEEKHVLLLVNSLPEVIKENSGRKQAHDTIFLKAYIQNTPTKTDKYYYVTIGEERGERLFTYDWYKVDNRSYAVSYYDVVNNKTVSLEARRLQLNHQPKRKSRS